jgi:hypothetical protein
MAGGFLLPFSLAALIDSITFSMIAEKMKILPIYMIIEASSFQMIGCALLSTLSTSSSISRAQCDYEIIAGFECDVNISILMLLTLCSIEKRNQDNELHLRHIFARS